MHYFEIQKEIHTLVISALLYENAEIKLYLWKDSRAYIFAVRAVISQRHKRNIQGVTQRGHVTHSFKYILL